MEKTLEIYLNAHALRGDVAAGALMEGRYAVTEVETQLQKIRHSSL